MAHSSKNIRNYITLTPRHCDTNTKEATEADSSITMKMFEVPLIILFEHLTHKIDLPCMMVPYFSTLQWQDCSQIFKTTDCIFTF